MEKRKIIIVDDNPSNLTACKKTLKDFYDVFPAPSAEKMFEILERITPSLILLDVEMPTMNGYEAMRVLRQNPAYKDVPVIFLSAMDDAQSEIEGLGLGAVDYIHKPFVGALLIKRIETHIALIEGKRELQTLNRSIDVLMSENKTRSPLEAPENSEVENTVKTLLAKELLDKEKILEKIGRELRAPLNAVIGMIELAARSDDAEQIKRYIAQADVETRLMLEMLDDVLDVS